MSVYKPFSYDLRLDGKTAIVTGGTSGIGNAIAKMLLWKGANVVILGSRETTPEVAADILAEVSAKYASDTGKTVTATVKGIRTDLRDKSQIQAAVDQTVSWFGSIDILVNCAGVGSGVQAVDITEEEFTNVVNMNLKAPFLMAQAVGREMIKAGKGGRIINITSDAGTLGIPDHVAYSASKAGLNSISRTLAVEWGKYGITTNAVAPTVVLTPMARDYWVGERAEKRLEQIPVGRFMELDEVPALVAFLASDGAQMINGQTIHTDGGYTVW